MKNQWNWFHHIHEKMMHSKSPLKRNLWLIIAKGDKFPRNLSRLFLLLKEEEHEDTTRHAVSSSNSVGIWLKWRIELYFIKTKSFSSLQKIITFCGPECPSYVPWIGWSTPTKMFIECSWAGDCAPKSKFLRNLLILYFSLPSIRYCSKEQSLLVMSQ